MEADTSRPYEPDDATLTLILQLQSEDIEELLNAGKGKGRDDEISDAHLAAATYQQELHTMSTRLDDRHMSRSLTRAVISDAALLNESIAEGNTAASDRALALSLGGVNTRSVVRSAVSQNVSADDPNDNFLARLAALYVNSVDGSLEDSVDNESPAAAESSTWAASRPATSTTASCHCVACSFMTPRSDVCQTPCGHFYCQECIQNLFKSSTADETMYPPRCCRQVISLSSVQMYLSPSALQNFEKKSIEFETSDRTYCSRQTCSSFIPPDHVTGERATCEECGTHTCTICKSNAHDGDCPQDVRTQQLLETAREHGWQRCYNCRRLVELDIGCNHITYVLYWRPQFSQMLTSVPAVVAKPNSGTSALSNAFQFSN